MVGARARDVAMKLMKGDEPKRRTEDLDVAIAIEIYISKLTVYQRKSF